MSYFLCKFLIVLDLVLLSFQSGLSENDLFTSVTYNLTIRNFNFENSIFNGILELQATTRKNISEITLDVGDYNVRSLEFYSDEFPIDCPSSIERQNNFVRIKIPEELKGGKDFILTIHFEDVFVNCWRISYFEKDSSLG